MILVLLGLERVNKDGVGVKMVDGQYVLITDAISYGGVPSVVLI